MKLFQARKREANHLACYASSLAWEARKSNDLRGSPFWRAFSPQKAHLFSNDFPVKAL